MKYHVEDIIKDVRTCIEDNATCDQMVGFEDTETLVFNDLVKSKITAGVRNTEVSAPIWMVEGKVLPIGYGGTIAVDEKSIQSGLAPENVDAAQVYLTDDDPNTNDGGVEVMTRALGDASAIIVGRDGGTTVLSVANGINWFDESGRRGGWFYLPADFLKLLVFEMDDWDMPVFETIDAVNPEYIRQKSRFEGTRGNWKNPVVAIVPKTGGKALEFYACKSSDAKVSTASYLSEPEIVDNYIDISRQCYKAAIYNITALVAMAREENEFAQIMTGVATSLLS